MSRRFYAVRVPAPAKVFESWEDCERTVRGVSGAQFKSFASRTEADAWVGLGASVAKVASGLRVYVDGSFKPGHSEAGWAWVAVEDGKEIARGSGVTDGPALSRNIDGECLAAVSALQWLQQVQRTGVICHDYEGLSRWALRQWKANSEIAKRYQESVRPLLSGNRFEKVTAHAGDPWNELVDLLAKAALDKL